MRFTELLIEYKREATAKNLGPKLLKAAEPEGVTDVDKILATLEDMDPTDNKQYTLWLANQYANQMFKLKDKKPKDLLQKFINAKSKLAQKDINQYNFPKLKAEMDKIYKAKIGQSKDKEPPTFEVPKDSKVIYNGPLGLLAVPKTKEASCELGSGTTWCTAGKKSNMFKQYDVKGPLYIWRDKNGEKYQFHFPDKYFQFMDSSDNEIIPSTLEYFRKEHPILKQLFAREEAKIAKDPERAYYYAVRVLRDRFLKGEAAIATDPKFAVSYAKEIMYGRFSEAEPTIAKSGVWSFWYARDALRSKFPDGESEIAKKAEPASRYAAEVLHGRFPEGEAAIATDPAYSVIYARNVIHGRFPEGEAAIATDPVEAYLYARDVIRGRWPEGEAAIAKSSDRAYNYALKILKGRFPEGEAAIARDANRSYAYATDIIDDRFPEGEPAIAKEKFLQSMYNGFLMLKGLRKKEK